MEKRGTGRRGEARCSGCNARVIWAFIEGEWKPMDAVRVQGWELISGERGEFEKGPMVWVSHFRTCPVREKFYGKRGA